MVHRSFASLAVLVAAVSGIAACGSSGNDSTSTGPGGSSQAGSSAQGGSAAAGKGGASAGGASGHATGGSAGGVAVGGSAGTGGAGGGAAGASAGGSAGHAVGGMSAGGTSAGGTSAGGSSAGGASAGGKGGASAGGTSAGGTSAGGTAGQGGASAGSGGSPLLCTAPMADCNGLASDGCEADTDTDPLNCGVCGMACAGGAMCVKGGCACAGSKQTATLIPLDMYIMLDHSGSMKSNNKWTSVTAALDMFFADPTAADLGVGLQFFPYNTNDTACLASNYSTPVVDIAPLSTAGQAMALTTAVANEKPNGGGTPTKPALQGAIDKVTAWKTAHPSHTVVVVLATDGQPNGCGSLTEVEMTAAAGFAATPSVSTYVIGVGSSTGNLDSIAMNGGTGTAFPVDNGDSGAFIAALKKIQGTSIGCQYLVPTPMPGQTTDFSKVNVEYTPGTGGPAVTLPYVGTMAGCAANPTGWYYDNPAAPTQILLCAAECTTVKADAMASVDVVLGCVTMKP